MRLLPLIFLLIGSFALANGNDTCLQKIVEAEGYFTLEQLQCALEEPSVKAAVSELCIPAGFPNQTFGAYLGFQNLVMLALDNLEKAREAAGEEAATDPVVIQWSQNYEHALKMQQTSVGYEPVTQALEAISYGIHSERCKD